MSDFDKIIFKKKTLSDIFEEIYINSKTKEKQISTLISELKPLINDIGDATLIVPLIKEYLEIGVKNDEALIKIAGIVQRAIQNSTSKGTDSFGLSEEEKNQIIEIAKSSSQK
jgi:hypothetical protein